MPDYLRRIEALEAHHGADGDDAIADLLFRERTRALLEYRNGRKLTEIELREELAELEDNYDDKWFERIKAKTLAMIDAEKTTKAESQPPIGRMDCISANYEANRCQQTQTIANKGEHHDDHR